MSAPSNLEAMAHAACLYVCSGTETCRCTACEHILAALRRVQRETVERACAAVCWRCEGGELLNPKTLMHYDDTNECGRIRAAFAEPGKEGK